MVYILTATLPKLITRGFFNKTESDLIAFREVKINKKF